MERNVYLKLALPEEAKRVWFEAVENECGRPGSEQVNLEHAAGRVCANAIMALRSSPAFHGAAMDGYAVCAEDTFRASPRKPFKGDLNINVWPVNTGQPLPEKANAVVMIEDANIDDSTGQILFEKAAFPWQNVRKTGEDIVETELILPAGTRIGAQEIGALAAGGVLRLEVFRKAKVAIIPTGSDLVPLGEANEAKLRAGQELPEFNSLVFSAMLEAAGAESLILPITPDDPDAILGVLREAARSGADLVLLNAGTSAGTRDFSANVLEKCGKVYTHGISLMPGKPLVLGIADLEGRKMPVAGIPGYPVSAWLAMDEFILPLLAAWQKREAEQRPEMTVHPVNALPSRPGMEERLRVKLGIVDGKAWAVPLPRGAGTVTSLSRADAIIAVPRDSEGLNGGQEVRASLLRPEAHIAGGLLAIGSHDNTLDLIDSLLRRKHPRFHLASAHVGSLGGLLALARGQAHLAGSHLLDPETGEYNRTAIRQYLKDVPVALIRLVDREQGIMTARGNPLNIRGIRDLARGDVRFINRQKGSGTRVLLDWELGRAGIHPEEIQGYEDEEYTHMNVAQAVLSGRADAGLGVKAAANALGLDFIPVGNEEYDLVIPRRFMEDERVKALLELVRSREFREAVQKLGGYGTERTGETVWEYDGD